MKQIPSEIFREYDIRGDAELDLTDENVLAIARAYATYLTRHGVKRAVVGGDVRLSTERIRASVIAGLCDCGVDVIDLGVVTSPMLYWSFFRFDCRGGVMITGSHNPKNMNGLKLGFDKATLYGEEIQKIRGLAQRAEFDLCGRRGTVERYDLKDGYLTMLLSKFALPRRPKIVIDPANGTAALFAREFFERLGCETVVINGEPDGTFPSHHPDPQKKENMVQLAEKVRECGAEVGFGFDGDADRIGVVDENGNVIGGDILMALFWGEILPKYPGATAIIEVKCSQALEDEVRRLGGKPYYYKAGHSLIKAEMKRIGAPFAGEYSGHMFFADEYYGFDDSFYAAARLLRILCATDKTLSQLRAAIPSYCATEEIRVDCPDEHKFEVMKGIAADVLRTHTAHTIDGVRIVYDGGWGLIRASNTQPVLAVRCEGRTPADRDAIAADISRRLKAAGLSDFEWKY
ncbi:MAG: phosphomannomutase/phosphoglucomutase [Pyramidobacter sp.]|nr:phosphomannomutase/phosphoglucomutase [Pyramidobacter sp.]